MEENELIKNDRFCPRDAIPNYRKMNRQRFRSYTCIYIYIYIVTAKISQQGELRLLVSYYL